ncbi:MAG TPA: hypothetical protein VIN39_11450 [Candidatus Dormibacteraeota bacterium]|jgi:hypothetical protein
MTAHSVGYELAAGTLGASGFPAGTGYVLQATGPLSLGPLLTAMAAALVLLQALSRFQAVARADLRPGDS